MTARTPTSMLLVALALPLTLAPLRAEEPQVLRSGVGEWSNLEGLAPGALLLIERGDGRLKGRLVSLAEDALSVHRRGDVTGVARWRVRRVWLLGGDKVGEGAVIGIFGGALFGGLFGGVACEDERGFCAGLLAVIFGGAGGGIGAAVGANVRERTLIYRAPPPGEPSAAEIHPATREVPADLAACAHPSPALLPSPLRVVYRPFNAERAARELAQQAEIK